MNDVLSGAVAAGYLVAGLFFLRFWKRTGDLLFALFALAFGVLAVQRCALALVGDQTEDDLVFYMIRLAAFLLILGAIWHKNRSSAKNG